MLNLFPISEADKNRLSSVSDRLDVVHGSAELLDGLDDPDLEVLFAKAPPPKSNAPRLRWLQVSSAGVDYLAGLATWDHGLTVTNARGVYAVPMAEYLMGAMLAVSNRVEERRQLQQQRRWPASLDEFECYGLRGKTLVIIGYGATGRETARLAAAFGMRIVAIKANPEDRSSASFHEPGTGDPDGVLPQFLGGLDALDWAVSQADYMALTLPLTASSRALIGRRVLGLLPRGAWILNVSRGGVIDEEAMTEFLRDGRIGGAWLDVFSIEPLPVDSPLWSLPNVVVTTHMAGGNRDSFRVLTDLCCENLRRYANGWPLLNQVDLARGY